MTLRPIYIAGFLDKTLVREQSVSFVWHPGFAVSQKQKNITAMHDAARKDCSIEKILEISSKSMQPLGVSLSAFNLMFHPPSNRVFSVESAFQSSKIFEHGGPYFDLLNKSSHEAKKDPRLKESGQLIGFRFIKQEWPLVPRTAFYDWLYIQALRQHEEFAEQILEYNAFTDIEFNPNKSINCQARSAALFVSLHKRKLLKVATSSKDIFLKILEEYKYHTHLQKHDDTPFLF